MLHQLVLNVELSFEFLLVFSELHFAAKTLETETIKNKQSVTL